MGRKWNGLRKSSVLPSDVVSELARRAGRSLLPSVTLCPEHGQISLGFWLMCF